MQSTIHIYEVRPRTDKRGVDLISDELPPGRLWYETPDNAISYVEHLGHSRGGRPPKHGEGLMTVPSSAK